MRATIPVHHERQVSTEPLARQRAGNKRTLSVSDDADTRSLALRRNLIQILSPESNIRLSVSYRVCIDKVAQIKAHISN